MSENSASPSNGPDAPVRVRFAPSPTGYLHVGGVRTLLFNWLLARKHDGRLILRIENTDQKRSTPEAERMMLEDVRALNIDYDEGPEGVGGDFGPYRQSERMGIYHEHARRLLDEDRAYHCFCPPELIAEKREAAIKMGRVPLYDGTCRKLSRKQAEKRVADGEKAGLRFKVPKKVMAIDDLVRGRIEFPADTVGDFLITRSPTVEESSRAGGLGMPVYNFACVIDDHLMELTHIVRGEDHLSNTARQLFLYDAFGWELPKFAHIAMVLGADRQKLSKRNGDVSAKDYLERGYLPDALLNFLALLGWWPPQGLEPASGHPEILSREEMIEAFSMSGLQKSPAVFDVQKLNWMNGFYLRAMPLKDVAALARPFFDKHGSRPLRAAVEAHSQEWFEELVDIFRTEVNLLSEFPHAAAFLFSENPEMEAEARSELTVEGAAEVVAAIEDEVAAVDGELSAEDVKSLQKRVTERTGAKGKKLFMPLRAAVTGRTHGPEIKRVLPLLGKEAVLNRIRIFRAQAGVK